MPRDGRQEPSFKPKAAESSPVQPFDAGARVASVSREKPDPYGRFVIPGVCAAVLAVIIGYPLLNESTGSECGALERRVLAFQFASQPRHSDSAFGTALAGAFVNAQSNGFIATAAVKQRYPNVPPFLSCTLEYWNLAVNPAAAQELAARSPSTQ